MNVTSLMIIATAIIIFTLPCMRSEFSFPNDKPTFHKSSSPNAAQVPLYRDDDDPSPEGKNMHRVNKIKKKLRRICLSSGSSRSVRSANPDGKFFFPTVVQQTDVNVDVGAGGYDQYDDEPSGSTFASGIDCAQLYHLGFLTPHHPLVGAVGTGGGDDGGDTTDHNRIYRKNFNRHVIRPLYRSIKMIYRLLK